MKFRYMLFIILILCGFIIFGCSKSEDQEEVTSREIAQWEKMMKDMNMNGPHFTQIVGMSAYVPDEMEDIHLALDLDEPRARYQFTEQQTRLCESSIRKLLASSKQVKISVYRDDTHNRETFTITDTDVFRDISHQFGFSDNPVLSFPVMWDRGADVSMLIFEPSGLTLIREGPMRDGTLESPPDLFVIFQGKSFQEAECHLTVESINAFEALTPLF